VAAIDKARIFALLEARLREQLESATASQRMTEQGVTHEESRPENDKDTRAIEASYLARGQAQRVAELSDALGRLNSIAVRNASPGDPAALGRLVEVEDDAGSAWYFVAPAGGGLRLEADGFRCTVVTSDSPVGRALLGRRVGDDVDIKTPQGVREGSLVTIL
jgi:transcription elongation GreA/GreB family factor